MCAQSQPNETIVLDFHEEPLLRNEEVLEFRLLYSGRLLGASKNNTRADHKHELRRAFHPQMSRLWATNPNIRDYARLTAFNEQFYDPNRPVDQELDQDADSLAGKGIWRLASKFERCGYHFVPLVTEELAVRCNIDILFLRPEGSGRLINSGDIDNRVKTLFDALRVPGNCSEVGNSPPLADENPFYCLLEDDRLISEVRISTDQLLLLPKERELNQNDVFLVIKVTIQPSRFSMGTLRFI